MSEVKDIGREGCFVGCRITRSQVLELGLRKTEVLVWSGLVDQVDRLIGQNMILDILQGWTPRPVEK